MLKSIHSGTRAIIVGMAAMAGMAGTVAFAQSTTDPTDPLVDADRHDHTRRPEVGSPQRPELSTPENRDTGEPFHTWQHLTDDWGGLRPQLDDMGITIEADITLDVSKNLHGGINTNGTNIRHLFNFNLTLDTQRLGLWDGGTAFFNFQNHQGPQGSEDTGDLQGISNIDADRRTQLSELWYEQQLFDGALRIKLGKIDANGEFAYVEHGGEFLNSSFGISPTILGMPTYPDPAGGAVIFVEPCEQFYAGLGVFDGAGQEGVPTGSRGIKTLFGSPADLFLIGEVGVRWSLGEAGLSGRAGLGAWHHTGTFDRLAGGTNDGTEGFYLLFDQQLCRENPADEEDGQGVAFFLQYGWADRRVSEIEHHIGLGLAWTGAIPTRDDDVLGAGVTMVLLSDAGGFEESHETTVEVFYRVQITPAISVKPDVQYIMNPSGGAVNDVVVATVRVQIAF